MKKLVIALLLAAILWTIMFSPLTAPWVNFWYMMTASAATPGGICHMCPSRVVETGKVDNLRITPGNRYRLGIVGNILGGRQAGSLDV